MIVSRYPGGSPLCDFVQSTRWSILTTAAGCFPTELEPGVAVTGNEPGLRGQ